MAGESGPRDNSPDDPIGKPSNPHSISGRLRANELYEEHSGMTHPMANIPIAEEVFYGPNNELSQRGGHQNVMQIDDRSNQAYLAKTVVQSGIYRNGDRVVADYTTYTDGVRLIAATDHTVYGVDDLFIVSHRNDWTFPNNFGPTETPTFNIGDCITVTREFPIHTYEEHSGMTRPMANIPISDRWEDSSVPTIVHHHVGHEYWIRSSSDVVPGQIITNQDAVQGGFVAAEYLGVVDGDHTWRSTQAYNAPRKYQTIWNQVKDWVSDDGELTADDYYQRVTGHVLFRDVYIHQDQSGDKTFEWYYFEDGKTIFTKNKWDAFHSPKFDWTKYDAFYVEAKYDYQVGGWLMKVSHKSDLAGPCGTCRAFMERVPVAVGGILL